MQNPILSPLDILPSESGMEVACVMNPGAFKYNNKIWLIVRVAERPRELDNHTLIPMLDAEDKVSVVSYQKNDPKIDSSDARYVVYDKIYYLSTLSHLVLLCSDDGIQFYEPAGYTTRIFGKGHLESFGIEDCRVVEMEDSFFLTYTQVSSNGVGIGLMSTKDWKSINRLGMVFLPANKDCAIFGEKINELYYCFNRPSSMLFGGNYIWLSSSPDMIHWGQHHCLIKSRPGRWDSERVGAGASPIRTEKGWLTIYHGADRSHRYCLGALLLDLEDPRIIIARSTEPIMEPVMDYEQAGFFSNVIFTNGHLVDGDQITMYYGASDTVICMATFSIEEILQNLG